MTTTVQGYCPMGCGSTLMLGQSGYVTCGYLPCPAPDAVSTLLGDRETEHVVVFGAESFDVQHPLRERLNGDLFDCGLHSYISHLDGPPVVPGRYRVTFRQDRSVGRCSYLPLGGETS